MQAVQFSFRDKKLKFTQLPVPTAEDCKENEVLIKVSHAGICQTDIHIIKGEYRCLEGNPVTLGHEFSGKIKEIGRNVCQFKPGDRVVVDPNSGCRRCNFCRNGRPQFCKDAVADITGIYKDGGWAQYAVVPVQQVHLLPANISLEHGALTEPVSCLTHGMDLIEPVPIGKNILILGAGLIGMLWASSLHYKGHRKVTVSEPNQLRLDYLSKLDLDFTMVSPDQLKQKQSKDPTCWFDLIIDCSGNAPAIEQAIGMLNYGGTFLLFGVTAPSDKVTITPFDIYFRELKIMGSFINPFSFPKSLNLLECLGDRYLDFNKLGIKMYTLDEYEHAIQDIQEGTITKAIFTCNPPNRCSCASKKHH